VGLDTVRVRDYQAEDIPAMLRVIKESFAEYDGRLVPPSSARGKTIEILESELERAQALVVEAAGEIVGCVLFRPRDEGIYFERLSVLPGYRNRGLAQLMLAEVERRALEAGERSLWLSVRLVLTELRDFYNRLGFKPFEYGTHEGYEGPTYVKMRKEIMRQPA
jgi:ribosomal protein S18 acetylase RimI-like enzyme